MKWRLPYFTFARKSSTHLNRTQTLLNVRIPPNMKKFYSKSTKLQAEFCSKLRESKWEHKSPSSKNLLESPKKLLKTQPSPPPTLHFHIVWNLSSGVKGVTFWIHWLIKTAWKLHVGFIYTQRFWVSTMCDVLFILLFHFGLKRNDLFSSLWVSDNWMQRPLQILFRYLFLVPKGLQPMIKMDFFAFSF